MRFEKNLFDFFFQNQSDCVQSKLVLEVGSGTGLVAIVAGLCGAKTVFATDLPFILPLLKINLDKNVSNSVGIFDISTLDVTSPPNFEDVEMGDVDVVIGTDVVYDYEITDGLVDTIKKLICRKPFKEKKFLFSVEKRYIFSVDSLDTVAPAFDYFETRLEDLKSDLLLNDNVILEIDYIPISQIFQSFCYERSKDLTLLKLVSSLNKK
jgi:predicted nicotinamide N-methyase